MTSFGVLYELFPNQMFDLCLLECFNERRPVFQAHGFDHFDNQCEFCDRQSLFEWTGTTSGGNGYYEYEPWEPRKAAPHQKSYFYNGVVPGNTRLRHCGSPQCKELSHWYWTCRKAASHRTAFRTFFGHAWRELPKDVALPAMLAHMLKQRAEQFKRTNDDDA